MDLEKIIEKILTIRSLSDISWDKTTLFSFSDDEIDYNFFIWLKEDNIDLYNEYIENLKTIDLEIKSSKITDFLTVMSETNGEEDLIEVIINFISEDDDCLEELNDEINRLLKKEKVLYPFDDEYDDSDEYESYDKLSKEDKYDDYDYYDEDYY